MLKQRETIEIDFVNLKMVAVQAAATIIFTCRWRLPEADRGPDRVEGYDPIAVLLSQYVNWAPHGYTNSLQAMVELIYDVQSLHIKNQDQMWFLDNGELRIISDALIAYQEWKTSHINAEKLRYDSPNWGDDTGFNQRDWTDQNAAFLDTVRA